mgnify:CR=1 FL=1
MKDHPSAVKASKEALDSELSLRLLSSVEYDHSVTQRSLATRLGIAVGLANAYFKRCVRKGWVKAQEVPAKRYTYYLTPKGFSEKSRLVGEYLTSSLGLFRDAREQYGECLNLCNESSWTNVALVGEGDLAEIAIIAALDSPIELKTIIAPGSNRETMLGLRVVTSIEQSSRFDAVLLTDMRSAQATYEALLRHLPDERIVAPQVLRVTRKPNGAGK